MGHKELDMTEQLNNNNKNSKLSLHPFPLPSWATTWLIFFFLTKIQQHQLDICNVLSSKLRISGMTIMYAREIKINTMCLVPELIFNNQEPAAVDKIFNEKITHSLTSYSILVLSINQVFTRCPPNAWQCLRKGKTSFCTTQPAFIHQMFFESLPYISFCCQ